MLYIISTPNKNPPLIRNPPFGGNKYVFLSIYTEARLPPSYETIFGSIYPPHKKPPPNKKPPLGG